MSLVKKVNTEKGKLSEKVGRKATGLSPFLKDMAAGLPGEYSTSQECVSHGNTPGGYCENIIRHTS